MAQTWRIGEVAERTGLTRRTLRHYDDLGLLVPSGRSWGDYRLYDSDDLLRLLQVQNLKALGLSLAEIADALADPELDAGATLRSHLARLEQQIAAEQDLAVRLRHLAEADERSWEDVLSAIAATRRLAHPDPTVRLRTALGAEGTTSELLDALAAEPDPAVQEVLVWSLAQRPDAAAAALAGVPTAGADLRALLARLLGKTRDAAAAPTLIGLLTDPEPRVVRSAVRALAAIGAAEAAVPLVGLLGRPDLPRADLVDAIVATLAAASVTSAAGSHPGAADDPATVAFERLTAAAGASDVGVRESVAEVLGRFGVSSSTEFGGRTHTLLRELLADADPAVRLAALVALADLGTDARREVESALTDPSLAAVARRLLDLHAT